MSFHVMRANTCADERALVATTFWLRVGFVGVSVMAVGLIHLLESDAHALSALALAVSGGALTIASWRRGWTMIARADPEPETVIAPKTGVPHLPHSDSLKANP